jgi:hypothetical protein
VLSFGKMNVNRAKTYYRMNSLHSLGVLLMISLVITGLCIMLALYRRSSMALKQRIDRLQHRSSYNHYRALGVVHDLE